MRYEERPIYFCIIKFNYFQLYLFLYLMYPHLCMHVYIYHLIIGMLVFVS